MTMDPPVLDHVDDVGAPVTDLAHRTAEMPRSQARQRCRRSVDREAERAELGGRSAAPPPCRRRRRCTGRRPWWASRCERSHERLLERGAEVGIDAHDLAGRFHLRAERGVDVDQLDGREHRRLHCHERARRDEARRPSQLGERSATHDARGQLDHGDAGHLAQERDGAAKRADSPRAHGDSAVHPNLDGCTGRDAERGAEATVGRQSAASRHHRDASGRWP